MKLFRGRFIARVVVAGAIGAAGLFAMPLAAQAHVTVQPGEATQGGYGVVTFRVPNESDTASTVSVTVTLPIDHPITGVRTTPIPGWDVATKTTTLDEPVVSHGREIAEVISEVTWTATADNGIAPGTYRDFPLSLGPLPETDEIVLPAVQTYDDGEVVAWDQLSEGDEEAERPAPVLRLVPGDDAGHHGTEAGSTSEDGDDSASDTLAIVVASIAALLALAALVVALRSRRAPRE